MVRRVPAMTAFRLPWWPMREPAKLRRSVEVVLALLLAVQLVRAVMALAAAAPTVPAPRIAGPAAPVALAGDPFFPQATAGAAPMRADTAAFTVHGINAGPAGSAILADAGGVQRAYRIGDAVPGGGVLREVRAGAVVVDGSGGPRTVKLTAASGTVPAANRPTASPPASPGAALLQQIGLRPRIEDGRHAGFEVIARGDAAALEAAGLQAGDVLQAIDGQPLTPERLGQFEQALLAGGQANVTVSRAGGARQITVQARQP